MLRRILFILVGLIFTINVVGIAPIRAQTPPCGRLNVGESGVVLGDGPTGQWLQQNPTTDPNNTVMLTKVPKGTIIVVLDKFCGPDGTWVKVSYQGITGWLMEGQAETTFIVPVNTQTGVNLCSGAPPSRVFLGSRAQRATNTKYGNGRVRSGPSQQFAIIRTANFGEVFTIINGPSCGGDSAWWQVRFDDGFTGWMMEGFIEPEGPDYYIEPATAQAPPCPIHSITVDKSLAYQVVDGKASWTGSPCDIVTLEVTNPRRSWVNLTISTTGSPNVQPAGGASNFYVQNKILAPNATIRLSVKFNRPNESVSVFLDATDETGRGAKTMNLFQAIADVLSIAGSHVGTIFEVAAEHYPAIVNAFGPHLNAAADALFAKDFATFKAEMMEAKDAGELATLADTLTDIGIAGAKEAFGKIYKEPGKILGLVEVIWRNYSNVFETLYRSPAGSIMFAAQ